MAMFNSFFVSLPEGTMGKSSMDHRFCDFGSVMMFSLLVCFFPMWASKIHHGKSYSLVAAERWWNSVTDASTRTLGGTYRHSVANKRCRQLETQPYINSYQLHALYILKTELLVELLSQQELFKNSYVILWYMTYMKDNLPWPKGNTSGPKVTVQVNHGFGMSKS